MSKLGGITEKIKKHKKLTIAGVVILIVAVVGTGVVSRANTRAQKGMAMMNQQQTAQMERRTLVSSVSATGTLTSVQSKQISVNLSGVEVESVLVQLGDMVEEGQVLCEFDSTDIEKDLADAKTALDVTNQKTQMDLTAAERNLADAKESYDTDLKRGNTDLDSAYNDYVLALEDKEEAEEEWVSAKAATIEKKGEYEYRQQQLEAKNAQVSAAGSSQSHQQEFESTKTALQTYVEDTTHQVTVASGALDKIGLGNDLSLVTVGAGSSNDFDTSSNSASKTAIEGYLENLKTYQSQYRSSQALEAEYASLSQEVMEWQTKYETAKKNESAAESTYEQQLSASQSKLSAYQKQQRSLDDTTKSAENSVINKTESLTTSQLNALTSGTNEKAKVEEYQQQLEDCTVKAPFSGVISAVNIEEGDTYSGGAIVTIDDISSFEVTAEIDEYDIAKIEKGQKVIIKTNATGDEELEGTVKIVSPKATTGTNDVTYTVTISVDTPNEILRMDMTAKLSIILDSKENVLTVPYEAVQEEESGKYYIEVIDSLEGSEDTGKTEADVQEKQPSEEQEKMTEKEKAGDMQKFPMEQMQSGSNTKRIYVEKGIESDYYIEVISDEITEGMEVVVPKSENENNGNIQLMMQGQGPMGGF